MIELIKSKLSLRTDFSRYIEYEESLIVSFVDKYCTLMEITN